MPAADNSTAIIELERQILRALCRDEISGSSRANLDAQSRAQAIAALSPCDWQDAEHRVVFEALARLPGRDAAELRHQLPAQATRMGFPDVCWERYFASDTSDDTKSADRRSGAFEALIKQLREASAETPS